MKGYEFSVATNEQNVLVKIRPAGGQTDKQKYITILIGMLSDTVCTAHVTSKPGSCKWTIELRNTIHGCTLTL